MKATVRFALFGILAGFVFGCPDEPPTPSGDLLRPAGLAYVPRDDARADVMIADSEARGVRVLQLFRDPDTSSVAVAEVFVPAPVVFFKLVIPASEYPTDLAVSEDGRRTFVISPVSRTLHVLHTELAPQEVSATLTETYYELGEIRLGELLTPDLVPVDLAVISRNGRNVALVAFDPLDSTKEGLLAAIEVESEEVIAGRLIETATIAPTPRDLAVRTEAPAGVWISSASSDVVSFVPLAGEGQGSVFGASIELSAGGPTSSVIDAGRAGGVGLRLDRNAAVVFDVVDGRLARADRIIEGLIPSVDSTGSASPGVLDLRSQPVSGAHALLDILPSNPGGLDLFLPEDRHPDLGNRGDVVMLVQVDGLAAFLVGAPLRAAVGENAKITRLAQTGANVSVDSCRISRASCGLGPEPVDPMCSASVVVSPSGALRSVRAVYQGALLERNTGEIEALSTSTSGPTEFGLTDALLVAGEQRPFSSFDIQVGDGALVQVVVSGCATGTTAPTELVAVGSVIDVSPARVRLLMPIGQPIAAVRPCGTQVFFPEVHYQIFAGGEELVVSGAGLTTARRSVERTPTGLPTVSIGSPLGVTITSSQGFSCSLEPVAGKPCVSAANCGGRDCLPSSAPGCSGVCDAACRPNETCFQSFLTRTCSGVEAEFGGAKLNLVDIGGAANVRLPEEVVFAPLLNGWLISYPGSRSLAEIKVVEGSFAVPRPVP